MAEKTSSALQRILSNGSGSLNLIGEKSKLTETRISVISLEIPVIAASISSVFLDSSYAI
jgi:hypothetical protein